MQYIVVKYFKYQSGHAKHSRASGAHRKGGSITNPKEQRVLSSAFTILRAWTPKTVAEVQSLLFFGRGRPAAAGYDS